MLSGTAFPIGASSVDEIVHVIQVALAPAFLLSALATLLNVFSTRLGRVADKVDAIKIELASADRAQADWLSRRLTTLRRRSVVLEIAVLFASLGGAMTGIAVLMLFVGALREASTAAILFGCFGVALVCTVAALAAFMLEILLAGRRLRLERAAAGIGGVIRAKKIRAELSGWFRFGRPRDDPPEVARGEPT